MKLVTAFISIFCFLQIGAYTAAEITQSDDDRQQISEVQNSVALNVLSNNTQPCGSVTSAILWAGQNINAGTVSVYNDANNLYVTYTTTSNWLLKKSHLYVGPCSAIPTNKGGNPMIGLFPYQTSFNPYVNTYTYIIPLSSLDDSCICIAAHAELVLIGQNGNIVQTETGWAGESLIGGNSWARRFEYCIQPCSETCEMIVEIELVSPSTCSLYNGSVTLVAQGGIAPYTYSVVNTSTGAVYSNSTGYFDNLSPGNYFAFVNDVNQCSPECQNTNFVIEFVPSSLDHSAQVSYGCSSQVGSTIILTPINAAGSVLYSIGGAFQASGVFTNVATGIYNTTVIDENGCSSNVIIEVESVSPLLLNVQSKQNATCSLNNGAVVLVATGGLLPFTYTLTNLITTQQYTNNTGIFNGLPAGPYSSAVIDANGCPNQNNCVIIPILNILKNCKPQQICKTLEENNLTIFPNPASKSATLSFDYMPYSALNLTITDMNGKIVLEKSNLLFDTFDLDITNFSTGTYVVNIFDQLNNQRLVRRLVVVSE